MRAAGAVGHSSSAPAGNLLQSPLQVGELALEVQQVGDGPPGAARDGGADEPPAPLQRGEETRVL